VWITADLVANSKRKNTNKKTSLGSRHTKPGPGPIDILAHCPSIFLS
jgi:hypothetical protein